VTVDPAQQSFLTTLDELQCWLREHRIAYAIIGSLAVAAYVDQGAGLDFNRPHSADTTQRMPDIDLIVPRDALAAVAEFTRAASTRTAFPVNVDTFAAQTDIDLRPHAATSYLTCRRLLLPVPTRLFVPRRVPLLGQQLTTIDPRVLLHTFGTIGGVIRKKDIPKIEALAAVITSGAAPSQFSERDCEVFSRYMQARKRQYPVYIAARRTWNEVLERLPPQARQVAKHRLTPVMKRALLHLNQTSDQRQRPTTGRSR
jgi:hypothetical protein